MTVVKEREDELTRKTLNALNEMRIKFPGKSDQEAEFILDRVRKTNFILFSSIKLCMKM